MSLTHRVDTIMAMVALERVRYRRQRRQIRRLAALVAAMCLLDALAVDWCAMQCLAAREWTAAGLWFAFMCGFAGIACRSLRQVRGR